MHKSQPPSRGNVEACPHRAGEGAGGRGARWDHDNRLKSEALASDSNNSLSRTKLAASTTGGGVLGQRERAAMKSSIRAPPSVPSIAAVNKCGVCVRLGDTILDENIKTKGKGVKCRAWRGREPIY